MPPYHYIPVAPPKPSKPVDYHAELLGIIDDLPPLPLVLDRLLQLLENADATSAQIATLIERDVVLGGSVLRCVNSAYYGLSATVGSIRHAVSLLGFSTIRNLALAFSWRRLIGSSRTPPPRLYARYSRHSIACAMLCHFLLRGSEVEEAAFAGGLFHDVGKLVILTGFPELLPAILERYEQQGLDWEQAETETLGLTHAQVSRMVLQKWQLPPVIQLAAEHHHHPERCPTAQSAPTLAQVVHAADLYVNQAGIEILATKRPVDAAAADQAMEQLGLAKKLPEAIEAFKGEYEGLARLF